MVRSLPASAAQVHLHPHDRDTAQEIPTHACRHSAAEIHPISDAVASEKHGAAMSVLSARRVTKSRKALKTTCQMHSRQQVHSIPIRDRTHTAP